MKRYRVVNLINETYQVLDREADDILYQGTLADCEAWIKLEEGGYF